MAESAVIGVLRALLTLDSAEYDEGLKRIKKDTKLAETTFGDLGSAVSGLGKILGGVFTAQAIIGFGEKILTFADQIGDLSDQTGISTTRLQALNLTMAGSGVTVDQLATGIGQLSKNLAGGDKGAAAAVRALGLNIDALLKMTPDDAFIEIGEAVSKIPDPMERSAIMMKLFGRNGAQYLKAVSADMRAVVEQTEKTGPIIDEELIKKADQFDKAWEKAKIHFMAFGAEMIGTAFSLGDVLGKISFPDADKFIGPKLSEGVKMVGDASVKTSSEVDQVGASSLAAAKEAIALEEAAKKAAEQGVKKLQEQAEKTAKALKEQLAKELKDSQDSALDAGDAFGIYFAELENTQALAMFNSATSEQTIKLQAATLAAGAYIEEQYRMIANEKLGSSLPEILMTATTPAIDSQNASVGVGASKMIEAHEKSLAWRASMDELSQSFLQFAQIAGDSLGQVVRQIGGVIAALDLAETSRDTLKQGFLSFKSGNILQGLSGIVGGIGGITSAALAAYQGIMALVGGLKSLFGGGWEGTTGNPKRDQFIAQYGGDLEMGQKILDKLIKGGMKEPEAEARRQQLMDAGLYAADSESDMRAAMTAIVDLIGGQVTLHSGGEVTARLKVGERVLSQDQNEWFNGVMDRMPTMDVLERVSGTKNAQATAAAPSADRRLEDLVERRLPKLVGRAVADALTLSPRLRTS